MRCLFMSRIDQSLLVALLFVAGCLTSWETKREVPYSVGMTYNQILERCSEAAIIGFVEQISSIPVTEQFENGFVLHDEVHGVILHFNRGHKLVRIERRPHNNALENIGTNAPNSQH